MASLRMYSSLESKCTKMVICNHLTNSEIKAIMLFRLLRAPSFCDFILSSLVLTAKDSDLIFLTYSVWKSNDLVKISSSLTFMISNTLSMK